MATERYSVAQVIQAVRDTKGLLSLAAKRLGCDRVTVYRYAKRYPSIAQALQDEREAMTDIAELSLFDKIQAGEAWAVCFYLKTQGKNRGYVERSAVTIDIEQRIIEAAEREGVDPKQAVETAKRILKDNRL